MGALQKVVDTLVGLLKRIGGVCLVGMMVVTCVDVIFRAMGKPIFGAVEIVSFMATLVLACAMPQTHVEKGHVGVDLVVRKLGPRTQAITDAITGLLATVVFALVCWQMLLYALTMRRTGEVSMSLEFPTYYLVFVLAVAFGVLSLVIFIDVVKNVRNAVAS